MTYQIEENGDITFSVISNGMTGDGWIERGNFFIEEGAASVLLSKAFKITSGVTSKIVVIPGWRLPCYEKRRTNSLLSDARARGLVLPRLEIACLIAEKLDSNNLEEMGVTYIMIMHEASQRDDYSYPMGVLLTVGYDNNNRYWLHGFAENQHSYMVLPIHFGFAFVDS